MSSFPSSIFEGRQVADRTGVTYDASKTKVFYAKDHNDLINEIESIEAILGINPQGDFTSVVDRLDGLENWVLDYASGDDIIAGTSEDKYINPKAMADADLNSRLKSKIKSFTRDYGSASGDVSYTGIGFKPTSMIVHYGKTGATVGDGQGFVDSSKVSGCINNRQNNNTIAINSNFIYSDPVSGGYQSAIVKSFNDDGFTLTWTKFGSPTGTLNLNLIAFK